MKGVSQSTVERRPTKRRREPLDTSLPHIEKLTITDGAEQSMELMPEGDEEGPPKRSVRKVLRFDSPEKT